MGISQSLSIAKRLFYYGAYVSKFGKLKWHLKLAVLIFNFLLYFIRLTSIVVSKLSLLQSGHNKKNTDISRSFFYRGKLHLRMHPPSPGGLSGLDFT